MRGNRCSAACPHSARGSIPACAGEPLVISFLLDSRTVYPRVCGGTCNRRARCGIRTGLSPRVRGNHTDAVNSLIRRRSIPACAGEPLPAPAAGPSDTVYPRVCGGTALRRLVVDYLLGLSPRVRGNRDGGCTRVGWRRSIPACAGEPDSKDPEAQRLKVYPRVCGGTHQDGIDCDRRPGLSPRVRGNQRDAEHWQWQSGSIPACAGEPWRGGWLRKALTVYPRVCGGTRKNMLRNAADEGLSPRVRGNRHARHRVTVLSGSIPACAGEPGGAGAEGGERGVYPRVCGGTTALSPYSPSIEGLSPRVRGNPGRGRETARGRGSIPACAGEPMYAIWRCMPERVYPRVCGGTFDAALEYLEDRGLSPRVRGNLVGIVEQRIDNRSIPACAGEPSQSAGTQPSSSVYPRVCGGTDLYWTPDTTDRGLSPRVRGNRVTYRLVPPTAGSIPACAGEPRP